MQIAGRTWPLVWQMCNWRGRAYVVVDAVWWYAWRKWQRMIGERHE